MDTWNMLNGKIAVYSVLADSEDEARDKIEAALRPRANRQHILTTWIAEGRPVRKQGAWRARNK